MSLSSAVLRTYKSPVLLVIDESVPSCLIFRSPAGPNVAGTLSAKFKVLPIYTDKERAELKDIMIEAIREYNSYTKYPPYRLDELQE